MLNTITIETGAAGVLAMSAYVGSTGAGLRKRPSHTGLVGAIALRSAVTSSFDASTWNRVDVPTPVPVRLGGAYG